MEVAFFEKSERPIYTTAAWYSKVGYRALIEQAGYRVVRHESMGFQVLLGVR